MVVREERIERLETALEREAVAAAEDFDRYDETAVIAQLERQVRACNEVQGITRSDAYPPQDDSLRKATLLIDGFRTIIAQCPTGENEESLSALRDLSAVLTARSRTGATSMTCSARSPRSWRTTSYSWSGPSQTRRSSASARSTGLAQKPLSRTCRRYGESTDTGARTKTRCAESWKCSPG